MPLSPWGVAVTNPTGQPANSAPEGAPPADPPQPPADPTPPGDGMTLDAAVAALAERDEQIKALRREAAGYRVKAKEARGKLSEFEEWRRSQMSDSERMQADLAAQREALLAEHRQVLADRYNVPAERAAYISGSTAEELRASAEALGEKTTQPPGAGVAPGGPNLHPGTRGAPVGSGAKPDANSMLRARLRGGRG
jgi:hypothetical protein